MSPMPRRVVMSKFTLVFVVSVTLVILTVEAYIVYVAVTSPTVVINDADAPNHVID